MFKILLVSPEKTRLSGLASALRSTHDEIDLSWAPSGGEALIKLKEAPVDLVVCDENVGDMTGLELAAKVITVDFLINCAIISSLSAEDFHEAGEGLGVLAQLPLHPGAEDAEKLLTRLKEIKGLLKK